MSLPEGGETASNSSQVQSSAEESQQPVVTFWQEVMDANTNHVYYWNPETNEVTWTLPANGVITNEVAGDDGDGDDGGGMGTGQGGMGTEKSATSGSSAESKTKKEVGSSSQKETAKLSATKKVAKKAEIDMFESLMEETSSPTKKNSTVSQALVEEDPRAAVATQEERSSSKKREASPEPADSGTDKEPLGT